MLNYIFYLFFTAVPSLEIPDVEIKEYSSDAYEIESKDLIYNEVHQEVFIEGKIIKSITDYKAPDGELLSKRIMKFGDDATRPTFSREDFRTGYLEGAETYYNGYVRVYYRDDFNSETKEEILEIEKPFVIDGGLTFFFRENWDRLLNDEIVEFNFVAPAKLDYFGFRVSKEKIVTIEGKEGMQIKLEPASFILRAFVDPIIATYSLDTQEIMYYTGISNIADETGESYTVEIDFLNSGELQ